VLKVLTLGRLHDISGSFSR